MSAKYSITIPACIDLLFTWPVLLYRWLKFGYTYRRIYLGEGEWALVDPLKFYRLKKFNWYLSGNKKQFYAFRNIKIGPGRTKMISMHREIMMATPGTLVDHRNNNGLDNLCDNLRFATRSQNMFNRSKKANATSRYRGVHFSSKLKKWIAKIAFKKNRINLGVFANEIDAAKAYDEAAKKYHGEFAKLNFPKEIERSPRRPKPLAEPPVSRFVSNQRGVSLRLANWLGAHLNFNHQDTKTRSKEQNVEDGGHRTEKTRR